MAYITNKCIFRMDWYIHDMAMAMAMAKATGKHHLLFSHIVSTERNTAHLYRFWCSNCRCVSVYCSKHSIYSPFYHHQIESKNEQLSHEQNFVFNFSFAHIFCEVYFTHSLVNVKIIGQNMKSILFIEFIENRSVSWMDKTTYRLWFVRINGFRFMPFLVWTH